MVKTSSGLVRLKIRRDHTRAQCIGDWIICLEMRAVYHPLVESTDGRDFKFRDFKFNTLDIDLIAVFSIIASNDTMN